MDDISNRFDYHPPKGEQTRFSHERVRGATKDLALAYVNLVPPGRERSLAITKLEEAMYWANAGIARNPWENS